MTPVEADAPGTVATRPVSVATRRRVERTAGDLAGGCLAAMEERQPWFARLPADQRAGVLLVTQTGVSNFVAWLAEPGETIRLTAEAFRIAPRDLARRFTLRQTVELVRIAIDVFEQRLPPLAADDAESRALSEAVLRFGREVAFAAATAYAGAAEARGAWDARLEALVVDGVVRGDSDDALVSRAAALGWDPAAAVRVVVGSAPLDDHPNPPETRLTELRRHAARAGRSVLVGVQGARLVVLLSEPAPDAAPAGHRRSPRRAPSPGRPAAARTPDQADPDPAAPGDRVSPVPRAVGLGSLIGDFGPGPVVVGPVAPNLVAAHASARVALAALRAAPGWPEAPRPVEADDLLPERAMCGDPMAHRRLVERVVEPLTAAGGELLRTLATYLEGGGALESCARALFVHPNTVRYRLRRVSELTGHTATDPRDALVLRTALVAGRLVAATCAEDRATVP